MATPRPRKNNRGGSGSSKLRGLPNDSPAVRLSKTLSWLLRHGAQSQGLPMREDGYVKVEDLLSNPKIKSAISPPLDLQGLQEIVNADSKKRYDLTYIGIDEEDQDGRGRGGGWYIKANQGHSIKTVKLDLKPILTVDDIPTRIAVHGTTRKAWGEIMASKGLSKMNRNHIHLAQGVSGENVISGMRQSSQILIYINVPLALSCGIKFYLSDNGVVLTEGSTGEKEEGEEDSVHNKDQNGTGKGRGSKGFLDKKFFERVESVEGGRREVVKGWEGKGLTQKEIETKVRETEVNTNSASSTSTTETRAGAGTKTVPAMATVVNEGGLEEKLGDVRIV